MEIFLNILTAVLTLGILAVVIAVALVLVGYSGEKNAKSEGKRKNAKENRTLRAFVRCNGVDCEKKYTYADAEDCSVANTLAGGPGMCSFSCLGLGSCVRACPVGAIFVENGIAEVAEDKCTGCGACIDVCPRGTIELVPVDKMHIVRCSSHDDGTEIREVCDVGCIGCGTCVNTCKCGAVAIEDNLAVIDYEKCNNCGECADNCLRGIITAKKEEVEESFDEEEYFDISISEDN